MTNEELAVLVKHGDREAAASLWDRVYRLIWRLMGPYYPLCKDWGLEDEDLRQCGYFAMLLAARYFKPEAGVLFTSCLHFQVMRVARYELGIDRHAKRPKGVISLDMEIAGDEGFTLADTIADPADQLETMQDNLHRQQFRACLDECLNAMPPDQAAIIRARFFEGKTLQVIAETTGTNAERIRQLESKALRELRKPRHARKLAAFFDGDTGAIRAGTVPRIRRPTSRDCSAETDLHKRLAYLTEQRKKWRQHNSVQTSNGPGNSKRFEWIHAFPGRSMGNPFDEEIKVLHMRIFCST